MNTKDVIILKQCNHCKLLDDFSSWLLIAGAVVIVAKAISGCSIKG